MYICSVSEGAAFHARLTVKPGRGYVQADENKKEDMPIGVLQSIQSTHLYVVSTTK